MGTTAPAAGEPTGSKGMPVDLALYSRRRLFECFRNHPLPVLSISTAIDITGYGPAGVCAERALGGKPVGQICPCTLEKLQGGFDSTLNLLLALLGGAALSRVGPPS